MLRFKSTVSGWAADALHPALEEREAKRHDRSTNDEIARRLEQSLEIDNREDQARQAEAMLMASMVMQTYTLM